jgi:hypothetical protein
MHRNPRLHRHKRIKEIIWSVHLAEKDMLVLVPTAVLVAHLSAIRLPLAPLLFPPGRPVSVGVTTLTKAQGKDSIALPRLIAWVSPSTLMEMLLWTRWQMYIATSNRPKQGKSNKHRYHHRCKHHRLHQCSTSKPSSNDCKHLVVLWPHDLHNARQELTIHMWRPLLGSLSPPLRRHNSTPCHQQQHSRPRTTRLRTCNLHTHMRMLHHHRCTTLRS